MVMAAAALGRSSLHSVGDNEKRWLVFGIGLNKVLVSQIRSFVEREIQKEYRNVKSSHGIDTQATPTRLTHWPAKKVFLKYENINGNDALPKVHGKFNDYSAFDFRVRSHIDFAKLYVENFMAKFNAFDEHCDASAVLILLSKVPVFSAAVQSAASDVRQSRNSWAHCAFKDWDTVKFRQSFNEMEKLVNALGLPAGDQAKLLDDLQGWETKGTMLCMNTTVDPALLQLVQNHVNTLKSDVDKMNFAMVSDRTSIEQALKNFDELDKRVSGLEQVQKSLKSDVEDVKQVVERVQVQKNWEISDCELDINFFAERHDPDTRHWLFDDFNKWFSYPGDSRAYVLLGDAGVGKSVFAGALAQRMKKAGHLGAAYFCRHNDGTRNDPRYLLGTVASQLCECNSHYNNIVGGVDSVITMLHNNKLGVQELFTKLLEEPLAKCTHIEERKLVIIDALDETEYESREDFPFLIKERFPHLPHWIVFFITSRPEDTIRGRLERYNPCVRICAGDREQNDIYQQHEGDIRRFFENGVDFSLLPFTVEEIAKSCNGLFLHAFYLRKKLSDLAKTGKMDYTLSDLLVDDIEDFFRDNFQRVFSKVGKDLYGKLMGCVLAAPSPLPVSFIPFVLQQETSSLDEQEVIDAVLQFALNQTSNDTVTFLHKLIPTWLTKNARREEHQQRTKRMRKDCPHLLIDKNKADEYLARRFEEILSGIVDESSPALSCINVDVQDYAFRFAIRFLCQYGEETRLDDDDDGDQESVGVVFRCLTSFHFLEKRIESANIGIYHLLEDLKLASCCPTFMDLHKKNILHEIYNALESNVHILLEWPHLLISCLRGGSKVLREIGLIPKLSSPLIELSAFHVESIDCLPGFNVFATASDKRTVAASNGRSIGFVHASRLKMVIGPFVVSQLIINEIKHLEFSPDGKWVFFGRLDKWFSVERKSVEDFSQFSGNEVSYGWSTFTRDDQYIVVERTGTFLVPCECEAELLAFWALQEIHHNRSEMTCSLETLPLLSNYASFGESGTLAERLLNCLKVPELYRPAEPFKRLVPCHHGTPFCEKLAELLWSTGDSSLTAVRQLIVELYPYIFDFQVWNVLTGRPLLHDVFSLSVQLNKFAYFWHVMHGRSMFGLYGIIAKAPSISNIAVANAVHAVIPSEMFYMLCGEINWWSLKRHPEGFSQEHHRFLKQVACVNFICVSPRKKWLLLSDPGDRSILRVYTLSKGNEVHHFLDANCIMRDPGDPLFDFTFTNDDSYFIYITLLGSLNVLCLQTGTILNCVKGKSFFCSTEGRQIGYYLFESDRGERKEICLTDLFSPLEFVGWEVARKLHPSDPLSYANYDSLIATLPSTEETISFLLRCLLADSCEEMLEMCVLSPDSKLIAIHRRSKIELVYSLVFPKTKVFTVYEQQSSFTAALAFSADSKLLLFCVHDGVNDPHFHVWDVKKCVSVSFELQGLRLPTVECCCLSSDKTKLILCGDKEVEIWEYDNPSRFLAKTGICLSYGTLKFSHCTVSLDNELLACCIGNILILYRLRGPESISQSKVLFLGHLARIQFCKFLKLNRYLITYDIDGLVFLWDLERTKAVAFVKITQNQESILSMFMLPEEDTAVCLLSSSRVCIIKLWRLECDAFSKFYITPTEANTAKSSETSPHTERVSISKPTISHATSRDKDVILSRWEEEDIFFNYENDDNGEDEDDDDDDDDVEVDKYD